MDPEAKWDQLLTAYAEGDWGQIEETANALLRWLDHLVLVPALVLLVIDTVLFSFGVYANGSFSSVVPAIMLAVGYDAMLILFSYWVVKIERRPS